MVRYQTKFMLPSLTVTIAKGGMDQVWALHCVTWIIDPILSACRHQSANTHPSLIEHYQHPLDQLDRIIGIDKKYVALLRIEITSFRLIYIASKRFKTIILAALPKLYHLFTLLYFKNHSLMSFKINIFNNFN